MPDAMKNLRDLEDILTARLERGGEGVVDRIADLFIAGLGPLAEEQIALFDQILGLLTDAIEVRARARLAERLADLESAPPRLIRRLSRDEIGVARPVLARSPRLSDEDLVAAARVGGRDHMLAISERVELSELVTDVLVSEGDREVVNAVAGNPGAHFSENGYDTLIERSRSDALLLATVGRRKDIPRRHMVALFELAKAAARERLSDVVVDGGVKSVAKAVEASARDIVAESKARSDAFLLAAQIVTAQMENDSLCEEILAAYARQGRLNETIVALSYLARVPTVIAERALTSSDGDSLLVLSRVAKLDWVSVRDLLKARPGIRRSPYEVQSLQEAYVRLTQDTAERVLRFMLIRESTASRR